MSVLVGPAAHSLAEPLMSAAKEGAAPVDRGGSRALGAPPLPEFSAPHITLQSACEWERPSGKGRQPLACAPVRLTLGPAQLSWRCFDGATGQATDEVHAVDIADVVGAAWAGAAGEGFAAAGDVSAARAATAHAEPAAVLRVFVYETCLPASCMASAPDKQVGPSRMRRELVFRFTAAHVRAAAAGLAGGSVGLPYAVVDPSGTSLIGSAHLAACWASAVGHQAQGLPCPILRPDAAPAAASGGACAATVGAGKSADSAAAAADAPTTAAAAAAAGWAAVLSRLQLPRRRLLVYINPVSGQGRGAALFAEHCASMLADAGCDVTQVREGSASAWPCEREGARRRCSHCVGDCVVGCCWGWYQRRVALLLHVCVAGSVRGLVTSQPCVATGSHGCCRHSSPPTTPPPPPPPSPPLPAPFRRW